MKLVALALAALSIFVSAQAGTIKGNAEVCTMLARTVQQVAEYRDTGQLWVDSESELVAAIREALGQEWSYIKDNEDADYVYTRMKAVWHEYKDMTPVNAGVTALLECTVEKNKSAYRRSKVKLT